MNVFAAPMVPDSMRRLPGRVVSQGMDETDGEEASAYQRRLAQMRANAAAKRGPRKRIPLTEIHGDTVVKLRESGLGYKQIAAQIGVSVTAAWQIDQRMRGRL